jgi:hypothetical protein
VLLLKTSISFCAMKSVRSSSKRARTFWVADLSAKFYSIWKRVLTRSRLALCLIFRLFSRLLAFFLAKEISARLAAPDYKPFIKAMHSFTASMAWLNLYNSSSKTA